MANRNFPNSRIYTGHVMPVLIDGNFVIGASGAVGTVKGPYIESITHLGTGLYQIKLQDNYNRYYGGWTGFVSPVTGSAIDPNAGATGSAYIITTVGDTDWTTAGVPAGVTPAVGVGFVLAAAPSAGTGRVKLVADSGISRIEVVGDSNLTLDPSSPNQGAVILMQCLQAQVPSATTQGTPIQYALANPAQGSVLGFTCYMSNSSILINGE